MSRVQTVQTKTITAAKKALQLGQITPTDFERLTDGKVSLKDMARADKVVEQAKTNLSALKKDKAPQSRLKPAQRRVETAKDLKKALYAQRLKQEQAAKRPATGSGKGTPSTGGGKGAPAPLPRPTANPPRPLPSTGSGKGTPSTGGGKGAPAPQPRPTANPPRPSTGGGKGSFPRPSTSGGKGSPG